jgi:hypothetical protein
VGEGEYIVNGLHERANLSAGVGSMKKGLFEFGHLWQMLNMEIEEGREEYRRSNDVCPKEINS